MKRKMKKTMSERESKRMKELKMKASKIAEKASMRTINSRTTRVTARRNRLVLCVDFVDD